MNDKEYMERCLKDALDYPFIHIKGLIKDFFDEFIDSFKKSWKTIKLTEYMKKYTRLYAKHCTKVPRHDSKFIDIYFAGASIANANTRHKPGFMTIENLFEMTKGNMFISVDRKILFNVILSHLFEDLIKKVN